ncbi:MAG TPA: flippase [Erysipelotrichaceae bacterium]|nr:flippase [Erysipelotrichaceae bacterium]
MKQVSLKKNIMLSTFYQVLKIITPFITAPYISRVLGVSKVGIFSYTSSYAMYFTLFGGLGTATYGTREIARVRNDEHKRSHLFWEIEILSVITTTISILAWGVFTLINTKYQVYYAVLTFNLLAVMFDISWFYAGIEQFQYTIGWNSFFKIASVVALFIFVHKPSDLLIYVFIMAFQNFAGNVGMWTGLPGFIHKVDLKTIKLKKHFHETLVYFIPTIATSVYNVLDKTMIGFITHNTKENGYYENANKILDMMKTLTFVALNSVMTSRISFLYKEKKFEEIKKRIHDSINYVLFMGIGILFGLSGVAKVFVPLFFGKGWDKTVDLLIIMSPVIVIIGLSNCLGSQYYTPSGRRKESAKYIIAGAVINFCFNCIFIPKLMSYGAAIATVIAETVITILYVHNDNDYLNWSDIFKMGWKKLIAGVIMFVILLGIRQVIHQPLLSVALMVIVGGASYILILTLLKDSFIEVGSKLVFGKFMHK